MLKLKPMKLISAGAILITIALLSAACGGSSNRNLSSFEGNQPSILQNITTAAAPATTASTTPAASATTTTSELPPLSTPPSTETPATENRSSAQPSGTVSSVIPIMFCQISFFRQTLTNCRTLTPSITAEEAASYNDSKDDPALVSFIFSSLFGRQVKYSIIGEDTMNAAYVWFADR